MFQDQTQSGVLQAVVVTVCLDPRLAERVVAAVDRMPWITDISHLDTYSSATRRPAFGPQMKAADAGFVFIDYTQDLQQAISCTQYLIENFGTKLTVVAFGLEERPDLILEAMRAGCSEYIASPVTETVLVDVVRRLSQRWSHSMRGTQQDGSIIALFGAKGGVGTTTLAVHLACYLSQCHKKRVLLIDSQPELGHACIFLGIDGGAFPFGEVVRNVSRLDSDLLQSFVAKHKSGISVLSSPDVALHQHSFDSASLAKTLAFVRSEFDYVIVDCDRSLSEITRTVLEAASRIFLVATPEISAVRDLSRYIDRIQHRDSTDLLQIVLNRCTAQAGIEVAKIEKTIRMPIHIRISNNYPALVKSGNLGEPLSPDYKTDVAHEMKKWAESLVNLHQAQELTSKTSAKSWNLWGRRPEAHRKGAAA